MGTIEKRIYGQTIPEYGCEIFTIKVFDKCVKKGLFINDNGSAYYVKDNKMCRDEEYFSSVPDDATHVVWFSK